MVSKRVLNVAALGCFLVLIGCLYVVFTNIFMVGFEGELVENWVALSIIFGSVTAGLLYFRGVAPKTSQLPKVSSEKKPVGSVEAPKVPNGYLVILPGSRILSDGLDLKLTQEALLYPIFAELPGASTEQNQNNKPRERMYFQKC